MIDFIQGEKFIGLAEFVFAPEGAKDCNTLVNTFCHCGLKEKNIVYTHTMYVRQLFEKIRGLKCSFILITHNCDTNVDGTFDVPDNVIKWYSQNVDVENPKIESIPIGLENGKWFKTVAKRDKMQKKLTERKHYKNLVYLNSNVKTNPSERQPLYDLFKDKPWVTSSYGVNGIGFEEYLDSIYNHKYVFCPRGNGIDTHRLWETLYLGSVPIVKKSINTWFYNEMPILYVNNWDEVNEALLLNMWNMFDGSEWDRDMLTFEYWKNRIWSFR
jgi:hypothetical protein